MGAINKHPSCKASWQLTTEAAEAVTTACAAAFNANSFLERVLLAEFAGKQETESAVGMQESLHRSAAFIHVAREKLKDAINVGEENPSPYTDEFRRIIPNLIAEQWDDKLLTGCKNEVRSIGEEIRSDHLAPMRRFVSMLDALERDTAAAVGVLKDASLLAKKGALRSALEKNEIPLQSTFAQLYSSWLQFMKEYLVDSLIATHVAFAATGKTALVA